MDNKFVYKTFYEHDVRNSILRKLGLWIAWITVGMWFIIPIVKLAFTLKSKLYFVSPELIVLSLWKQILAAFILFMFVPLEKEIKEQCDCELTIEENRVKILYKNLNYKDKKYGGLVDTLAVYQLKELNQFSSFEGGLKFRGKSEYRIYDKSGKKLSTSKDTSRHLVKFYVPTDIVFEVYKAITSSMNKKNNNL